MTTELTLESIQLELSYHSFLVSVWLQAYREIMYSLQMLSATFKGKENSVLNED